MAQLRFPLMPGSSNTVSLEEGQKNFVDHGVSQMRRRGATRAPLEGEDRDEGWRPVDVKRDNVERPQRGIGYADSYPESDPTVLYYWRSTYWRRFSA